MAESSSSGKRTYHVLPGLETIFPMEPEESKIIDRVRNYRSRADELQLLKTNHVDAGRSELHKLQYQRYNDINLSDRERHVLDKKISKVKEAMARSYSRTGFLEQHLQGETIGMYNWVLVNWVFVKDPPYAMHCTSIDQIYAVYILITQIANHWPRDRAFRIALGSNTTDGSSVQDLENYARLLNFEVVSLFGDQFAAGTSS